MHNFIDTKIIKSWNYTHMKNTYATQVKINTHNYTQGKYTVQQ